MAKQLGYHGHVAFYNKLDNALNPFARISNDQDALKMAREANCVRRKQELFIIVIDKPVSLDDNQLINVQENGNQFFEDDGEVVDDEAEEDKYEEQNHMNVDVPFNEVDEDLNVNGDMH